MAEVRVPVVVRLADLGSAVKDERWVPLDRRGLATRPQLVQGGDSTLEFVVQVPDAGALVLRPFPAVEPPAIEVQIGTTLQDRAPMTLTRGEDGHWEASLAAFAGRPVRLWLTNRARTITWLMAEVRGTAPAHPPLWARATTERPSVIVYVVDTLRADHLGVYGYDAPTSPRLDRLARQGLVVDWAYSVSASTAATVPSLFASIYPWRLGTRLWAERAPRTLAEVFQKAGYATLGLQGNFGLLAELGYARGFDDYRVMTRMVDGKKRYVRAARLHEAALDWLRARPDEPVFLYIQTMDVHFPHDAHPHFRGRIHPEAAAAPDVDLTAFEGTGVKPELVEAFAENLDIVAYDEDVAYAAHEFARFMRALDALGRLDDTLVLLTADHGEPLGDHGLALHGTAVFEEQVRVPFIVWGPGVTPGRWPGVVSLLDVGPTVLDWAGLPVPKSFRGRSLVRQRPGGAFDLVVGEKIPTFGYEKGRSWFARRGPWKLILTERGAQLYDLEQDPGETRDVSASHPLVRDALAQAVMAQVGSAGGKERPTVRRNDDLEPAVRKELDAALRALGYIQ